MGNLLEITENEFYKLGYECALDENGFDVSKFKLSEEEKELFMAGYTAALEKSQYSVSKEEPNSGLGKAA